MSETITAPMNKNAFERFLEQHDVQILTTPDVISRLGLYDEISLDHGQLDTYKFDADNGNILLITENTGNQGGLYQVIHKGPAFAKFPTEDGRYKVASMGKMQAYAWLDPVIE